MVQSAKRALKIVLNNVTVTDDVLCTAMTEVESLLNSRPLTHVSIDVSDPEALTPNHFLLGSACPHVPQDPSKMPSGISAKQWKEVQSLADRFWRRWMKEYVPYLTERRKWLSNRRNIAADDLVLIVDANSARGQWPLARVVRPIPGPDGIVRTAVVKTVRGEYIRPVAKLCLLEAAQDAD